MPFLNSAMSLGAIVTGTQLLVRPAVGVAIRVDSSRAGRRDGLRLLVLGLARLELAELPSRSRPSSSALPSSRRPSSSSAVFFSLAAGQAARPLGDGRDRGDRLRVELDVAWRSAPAPSRWPSASPSLIAFAMLAMRSFICGCDANMPFGSLDVLVALDQLGQDARRGRPARSRPCWRAATPTLSASFSSSRSNSLFEDVVVGGFGELATTLTRQAAARRPRRCQLRPPCSSGSALTVCFSVTCAISCAEHAGELRLALDQTERAARDVHEAARRGERVDAVGVEDDELPVEVGPRARLRQHGADQRDVLRDVRVLIDAEPSRSFVADLLAELALLLSRTSSGRRSSSPCSAP